MKVIRFIFSLPLKQHKNRELKEELNILMQKGFSRIYVDGRNNKTLKICLEGKIRNSETRNQKIFVLIDRIVVKEFDEDDIHRLSDSIGTAFYEGEGDVYLEVQMETKLLHFNNRFELDGITV